MCYCLAAPFSTFPKSFRIMESASDQEFPDQRRNWTSQSNSTPPNSNNVLFEWSVSCYEWMFTIKWILIGSTCREEALRRLWEQSMIPAEQMSKQNPLLYNVFKQFNFSLQNINWAFSLNSVTYSRKLPISITDWF